MRKLLAFFAVLAAVTTAWEQDRFVISFWVDPVVNASQFDIEYARISAAGFTTLLGGFGATTPATVREQVAACARAGLACIPSSCETVSGPNPTGSCVGVAAPVMGYQLFDEPQPSDFPGIAAWFSSLAQRAPGALRFVNLLPNYANFPQPGGFGAYVDAFVRAVKPDILCFDHYPLFYEGSDVAPGNVSQAGYLRNLAVFRSASLAAGIPFWNFFNSMPFNARPDVTEAQLRWQVFSSLAYGAKGVLYFCYWSPAGASFAWGNALMTPRAPPGGGAPVYLPGPHYYQAARVNQRLRAFGAFLLRATSTAVASARGDGQGGGGPQPGAGPVAALQSSIAGGANVPWSALLGAFSLPGGGVAVLVHNQDANYPVILHLTLSVAPLGEVDPVGGTVVPAWSDVVGPGFHVALEAGDARLLVWA
jgi:hypothetical protein